MQVRFPGVSAGKHVVNGRRINVRHSATRGDRPPRLRRHGFVQSHVILHEVARRPAPQLTGRRIDYIPQQVPQRLVDVMLGLFGE